MRWVKLDELDDYPMGKIDRQIAKKLEKSAGKDAQLNLL